MRRASLMLRGDDYAFLVALPEAADALHNPAAARADVASPH